MTLDELGDSANWRCWICDEPVPQSAKPNDPKQPVSDQIEPAAKGTKGRGDVRLAHKGCNDLRKGRPPTIPWPERFRVVDAPELLQSLQRIDKKRPPAGEVVATCVDEASASEAARWVVDVAATLHPGDWQTAFAPMGSMTAVRLIRR
ncbi:MAG: hypothetical protein Q8K63_04720 [Acidimicrobiales bacterium]|nr:hypothetical protein [Acidimicrobiales bacterium]